MILKNGYLFIDKEKKFVQQDIKIARGKIVAIGENLTGEVGEDQQDITNKYVIPGLIDAHSHIGVLETGMGWEGEDLGEYSEPVFPELCAIDGINPLDPAFQEALSGGVTIACTGPGSGCVVGGQFSTIRLFGNVIDQMVIKKQAAIKCALGENPKNIFGKENKLPQTRMGIAMLIRKILWEGAMYLEKKEKGNPDFTKDFRLESLIPVLKKEIPLKIHCHRADDICTAIRIGKEFDVDITLDHCTEGHLIADYIGMHDYPALIGPNFSTPSKIELKNKSMSTPQALMEKGVKVCIISDHGELPQESLIMCAALAKKNGLTEYQAISAVTKNPAQVLKLENKGVIEIGMDGDISIWKQHPFLLDAVCERVYYEGIEIYSK